MYAWFKTFPFLNLAFTITPALSLPNPFNPFPGCTQPHNPLTANPYKYTFLRVEWKMRKLITFFRMSHFSRR